MFLLEGEMGLLGFTSMTNLRDYKTDSIKMISLRKLM